MHTDRRDVRRDPSLTSIDPSPRAVELAVLQYLRSVDRVGDRSRMAQRVAREHVRGRRVVGGRRGGREFLVVDCSADPPVGRLLEVSRSGRASVVGSLWHGRSATEWLCEHRHYLEWIAPWFERAVDDHDDPVSRPD